MSVSIGLPPALGRCAEGLAYVFQGGVVWTEVGGVEKVVDWLGGENPQARAMYKGEGEGEGYMMVPFLPCRASLAWRALARDDHPLTRGRAACQAASWRVEPSFHPYTPSACILLAIGHRCYLILGRGEGT